MLPSLPNAPYSRISYKRKEVITSMIVSKIAAVAGATAMLLTTSGVAFGATVNINNTGANSRNRAKIRVERSYQVKQSNMTNIGNSVVITQNTGNNSASKNTGSGDVKTGDATADVFVANTTYANEAIDPCDCVDAPDVDHITIQKTGYKSTNDVDIRREARTRISTRNQTNASNLVDLLQRTGHNDADKNTMNGDVDTGDTDAIVNVINDLNM